MWTADIINRFKNEVQNGIPRSPLQSSRQRQLRDFLCADAHYVQMLRLVSGFLTPAAMAFSASRRPAGIGAS